MPCFELKGLTHTYAEDSFLKISETSSFRFLSLNFFEVTHLGRNRIKKACPVNKLKIKVGQYVVINTKSAYVKTLLRFCLR